MAVAEHLRLRAKAGVVWWHTPNTHSSLVFGNMLKKMGMRAGVSDIILFHNRELFALELKAKGGRPTIEQREFQDDINNAGGYCAIAEGLDTALACLNAWGLLK